MYTKIAKAPPSWSGRPSINAPSCYGAAAQKPFLWRVPVTGERPMRFDADLPSGLWIDGTSGIISGQIEREGEYSITVRAENSLGADEKNVRLEIGRNKVCRTPLLGWTSWNAFRQHVSHKNITETARLLVGTGLADHGFQYVNIDSGWQGVYGGEHDAITASPAFPDMKATVDVIHSYGLKAGIYSTPMQKAWGDTEAPGCTRGALDPRFNNTYFGIGSRRAEKENVAQWCDWGFDYLKYDWSPTDRYNAEFMKDALEASPRDFAFCVTIGAAWGDREYWAENCTSWRACRDSADNWQNVLSRFDNNHARWQSVARPGHYFDLDMLELGEQWSGDCRLTPDEQVVAFTIRAIFPSPIQISCDLAKLTDFDLALLTNDEVLAVNQDVLSAPARCIDEHRRGEGVDLTHTKLYEKQLSDGSVVLALFNLGETDAAIPLPPLGGRRARDLWAREAIAEWPDSLTLPPHTVRLVKLGGI